MREPSFFEKAGRTLGDNYRRMVDPNSNTNLRAKKARQNVKTAGKEFVGGLKGETIQRGAGGGGGGSGQVSDPSATYSGLGSFTAADPGTVTPQKEFDFGGENGDFNTFDNLTRGGNIGLGTKESPFTGTNSQPSGFSGESSKEYAENTDNGRFISGYNELGRGAALSDLYRPEQMRQAAANEISSDAYLAGLDQDKEQQRLQNFQRAAVRGRPGFRKLSQRRRSDQAIQAGEQMTDMNDRSSAERIMRGQNRVGMAQASADTQRGLAGQAKAQADIYDTDVTAGVKLAELEQNQVQYDQSRFSSPEQMNAHIISVLGKNDFPQALLNNRDFMDKLNMQVAQGADPQTQARIMMAQMDRGLGE